jgi:hypothetical protein
LLACDQPAESLPVAFVIDGHLMTLANTVPKPTRTTGGVTGFRLLIILYFRLHPERLG